MPQARRSAVSMKTIVPYDSRDLEGRVFDISGAELHGLLLQLAANTKNITSFWTVATPARWSEAPGCALFRLIRARRPRRPPTQWARAASESQAKQANPSTQGLPRPLPRRTHSSISPKARIMAR